MITHYCRPSDIVTDSAALSLTSGTAAAAFPLTNAQDRKAHTVFKSISTACTIRSHWSSAKTLQGLALINHKLAGATVTISNPAGLSTSFLISSNTPDGHCLDPWKSFVGLANVTDDDWDITITGAATVCAIGEILWIETLRRVPLRWGSEETEAHQAILHATDYGVRQKYAMGVRQRMKTGRLNLEANRAEILALQRDARGVSRSFLLVPDSTVNDALFVDLSSDDRTVTRVDTLVSEVELQFTEQQKGLAL